MIENKEFVTQAVGLWKAAHASFEQGEICKYLEGAKQFHELLVHHRLLNDSSTKEQIRLQTPTFTNATFLSRVSSVALYFSLGSDYETNPDLATQIGLIRNLHEQFLDFCSYQDKYLNDPTIRTLEDDKKIAQDILLCCAKEKFLQNASSPSKKKNKTSEKLSQCKTCGEVASLYQETFFMKPNKTQVDISKMGHKAFIIEHADYNGCEKLNECPLFQKAVFCEDEQALFDMCNKLVEENLERLLSKYIEAPEKPISPRLQYIILGILDKEDCPTDFLKTLKSIIDFRIRSLNSENKHSFFSLRMSSHNQESKALQTLSSILTQRIMAKQNSPRPTMTE